MGRGSKASSAWVNDLSTQPIMVWKQEHANYQGTEMERERNTHILALIHTYTHAHTPSQMYKCV